MASTPEQNRLYKLRREQREPGWRKKEHLRQMEADPKRKRRFRLAVYNLTVEEFNERVAAQGGVCAICRKPPSKKGFVVDHDHKTLVVRGILCVRCNVALGMAKDDVGILKRMIEYLER